MKIQKTKKAGVMAWVMGLGMWGMISVAAAQTTTSSGVTNVSAPKPAATTATASSTPVSSAQAGVTQVPAPAQTAATLTPPATNRVGDATNYLLALQASGQYASRNAYPVTSDVAQRTYQRYLESFTHKIPENAETQVGSKSGGSR